MDKQSQQRRTAAAMDHVASAHKGRTMTTDTDKQAYCAKCGFEAHECRCPAPGQQPQAAEKAVSISALFFKLHKQLDESIGEILERKDKAIHKLTHERDATLTDARAWKDADAAMIARERAAREAAEAKVVELTKALEFYAQATMEELDMDGGDNARDFLSTSEVKP